MKRIRRALSVSIALGLAVALMLPSAAYAALPFSGGIVLSVDGYWFDEPKIDGRYIIATRDNNASTDSGVVLFDRQTGTTQSWGLADGVDQDYCDVSGDRVVMIDHWLADEVWYLDLSVGPPWIQVTDDANDDVGAVIDGNIIAWVDGIAVGRKIRFYDIETGNAGVVGESVLPNGLCLDRGRVAWFDSGIATNIDGVYVYDVRSGAFDTVCERDSAVTRIDPTSVDIHGDIVTWSQYPVGTPDNKDVWAANVRTGLIGQVTNQPTTQTNPCAFGDLLAWQDDRSGNEDILAWWAPETPGFQDVARTAANEVSPAVYGHSVAYLADPGLNSDIGLSVAPLFARRLAGTNRYETSAAISSYRFPESSIAVIATGADFADALSASSLAGALECPLLLTAQGDLPTVIADELDRLGVLGVFVVGGTSAIGNAVTDELDDMGITVTRLAGANRYATARQVANRLIDVMIGENRHWRGEAFFCRGDDFADALAVAPHAYALGMPILLVQTNAVPADTAAAITALSIDDGYVIGGTSAISAATKTSLDTLCGNPTERWYGANRYETAAFCAWKGWDKGWLDWDAIGVATGTNFPDALSGGAASGYYGSPIVLTAPTAVPPAVHSFFTVHRYDFGGMDVYGGVGAVNAATFTQLEGYLD